MPLILKLGAFVQTFKVRDSKTVVYVSIALSCFKCLCIFFIINFFPNSFTPLSHPDLLCAPLDCAVVRCGLLCLGVVVVPNSFGRFRHVLHVPCGAEVHLLSDALSDSAQL